MNLLDWFPGLKTYIAAVGLIGLGVYQVSQGDINLGLTSIVGGLMGIFARRAIDRK